MVSQSERRPLEIPHRILSFMSFPQNHWWPWKAPGSSTYIMESVHLSKEIMVTELSDFILSLKREGGVCNTTNPLGCLSTKKSKIGFSQQPFQSVTFQRCKSATYNLKIINVYLIGLKGTNRREIMCVTGNPANYYYPLTSKIIDAKREPSTATLPTSI